MKYLYICSRVSTGIFKEREDKTEDVEDEGIANQQLLSHLGWVITESQCNCEWYKRAPRTMNWGISMSIQSSRNRKLSAKAHENPKQPFNYRYLYAWHSNVTIDGRGIGSQRATSPFAIGPLQASYHQHKSSSQPTTVLLAFFTSCWYHDLTSNFHVAHVDRVLGWGAHYHNSQFSAKKPPKNLNLGVTIA